MSYIEKPVCLRCNSREYIGFTCSCCSEENKIYKNIMGNIKGYNNIDEYYKENILDPILKQESLTKENDEIFKILLGTKMIKDEALPDEAVLGCILKNKKVITYETFEQLLKRYVEKFMKFFCHTIENYNPLCFILPLEGKSGTSSGNTTVEIDTEVCKRLYDNADIYSVIVIYHELWHIVQNVMIKSGFFFENNMLVLKENLICEYENRNYKTDTYYHNNYQNISFEVDARDFSISWTILLLAKVSLSLSNETLKDLNKNYVMDTGILERKIIIDGKEEYKTVDEIFDEVIKLNPEYLDLYPQLKVEYIKEDNSVRRKTKDELIDSLIDNIDDDKKCNYIKGLLNPRKTDLNL